MVALEDRLAFGIWDGRRHCWSGVGDASAQETRSGLSGVLGEPGPPGLTDPGKKESAGAASRTWLKKWSRSAVIIRTVALRQARLSTSGSRVMAWVRERLSLGCRRTGVRRLVPCLELVLRPRDRHEIRDPRHPIVEDVPQQTEHPAGPQHPTHLRERDGMVEPVPGLSDQHRVQAGEPVKVMEDLAEG